MVMIMDSLCGLDCNECGYMGKCGGCVATGGKPFGGTCVVGLCCEKRVCENHGQVFSKGCGLMRSAVNEFNALEIEGLDKIDSLNLLIGAAVNLEFKLPSGQNVKFWDDRRVYFGTQLNKRAIGCDGSCDSNCAGNRYFGLVADEKYLLVCEYGENGSDAEIIL